MVDQRPQDGGGGSSAERTDESPVIVAGPPLPAAVAGGHPRGLVEKVWDLRQHFGASRHCERSKAIQKKRSKSGLLRRGACHRARIRATRWLLAMTLRLSRRTVSRLFCRIQMMPEVMVLRR